MIFPYCTSTSCPFRCSCVRSATRIFEESTILSSTSKPYTVLLVELVVKIVEKRTSEVILRIGSILKPVTRNFKDCVTWMLLLYIKHCRILRFSLCLVLNPLSEVLIAAISFGTSFLLLVVGVRVPLLLQDLPKKVRFCVPCQSCTWCRWWSALWKLWKIWFCQWECLQKAPQNLYMIDDLIHVELSQNWLAMIIILLFCVKIFYSFSSAIIIIFCCKFLTSTIRRLSRGTVMNMYMYM